RKRAPPLARGPTSARGSFNHRTSGNQASARDRTRSGPHTSGTPSRWFVACSGGTSVRAYDMTRKVLLPVAPHQPRLWRAGDGGSGAHVVEVVRHVVQEVPAEGPHGEGGPVGAPSDPLELVGAHGVEPVRHRVAGG